MNNAHVGLNGFQRLLERRELELVQALRSWDCISIQRSADQMDELQLASERDLAIRNLDTASVLLRRVRAARRRIRDGRFGICIDCEQTISTKRLEAVPWALRCIRCQEAAEGEGEERADVSSRTLIHTA
jgi:DnaK suppressor protein